MLLLSKRTIIIVFLTACMLLSFYIGTKSVFLPLYVPVTIFSIVLIFSIKPVPFINKIVMLYKKTPFKYLIWFSLWSFITIVINALFGRFFLNGFITSTIGGLLISVLFPIIFICFLCPKYISYKFLIKFLYLFCWFIFSLAIIEFFVFFFDIKIIENIISVLCNRRSFASSTIDVTSRFFVSIFPRSRSIFDEPAYLGYFSFVLSPIIYELTLSKSKIYNNTILNKIIKKTIIPFMWIAIIFSQSPIYFLYNLIFTLYYFLLYKKGLGTIIKLLKKHIIFITSISIFCIITIILFFLTNNINFEETFLNRILLVITNIDSFETFIFVEPSLGTRIISYVNELILVFKNLLFGVGYGNMSHLLADQLAVSPLPLTTELQLYIVASKTSASGNIFCKIFSETSFIGLFLFYYFIYKTYLNIRQRVMLNNQNELVNAFIKGLTLFCITYSISTIYDSNMNFPCYWILFAIIISIIYNNKMQSNTLTILNSNQNLREQRGKNE